VKPARPRAIDFSNGVAGTLRCQWVIWDGSGKTCTWCGHVFSEWSCGVMIADDRRFAAWCGACTLAWAADTDMKLHERMVDEFLDFVEAALIQRCGGPHVEGI